MNDRRLAFVALLALGIAAAAPSIIFPGIVGALEMSGRYSAASAASVVAVEMAGMLVAALLVSWSGARLPFRRIAAFGVVTFVVADLAAAVLPPLELLRALRFVAGLGEGAGIAAMAAMAASRAAPERYFAASVACNLAAGALLLQLLPGITAALGGGVFVAMALVSVPALLLLPALPQTTGVSVGMASAGTPIQPLVVSWPVVFACLGTLLFFAAISAAWSMVAPAAARAGLAFDDAAQILATATLAGIATGLFASWIGPRVARHWALLLGTGALALALARLAAGPAAGSFLLVTLWLMVSYVFALPFYLGTVAALDRSGRVAAFSMALQFAGLAIGPALAASLPELRQVFVVGLAMCLSAGALSFGASRIAPGQAAEPV
jgi:MFS transporter, DHA1 family, inner membrane transport protein